MTRINCGIPPVELTDKHLLAEHREIKRVPNLIKKGKYTLKGIPNQFKLGTGHVKFFYNKLSYLHKRYNEIYQECLKRKFNVTDYNEAFTDLPPDLYLDYTPEERDKEIIRKRIQERLNKTK